MAEARVERRLAAILAADVVGYSRLMGADEESTLAALMAHQREIIEPSISGHRGRIFKTTGDGVLAEFSSAVDAVCCAVEIQGAIADRNTAIASDRRLVFRMGINVGDVMVADGDVFGDGVNIAARMEGLSAPGGICLTEDAYRQIDGKIRLELDDIGEQTLKNIARPVRAYEVRLPGVPSAAGQVTPTSPAIAVLPFSNMSADPDQEYFADGMVEEIITGLSRIRWLQVISRNSTFIYKHAGVDVAEAANKLGVRYIVQGGVRKAGSRIRITAQLVDAPSGMQLWAEKYDRLIEDVFALQDEITVCILGAIEPSLRRAEIERVKRQRPTSLSAYDCVLRALPLIYVSMPNTAEVAIPLLEEALRIEPSYSSAHAFLALSLMVRVSRGAPSPEDRARAIRHARAATAHGNDDATSLAVAGFVVAMIERDETAARRLFDRALNLSNSNVFALAFGAQALAWMGEPGLAIERAEQALRLSPFDTLNYRTNQALAVSYFQREQYPEALEAARRVVDSNPSFSIGHALLSAALIRLGRRDEAEASARAVLACQPSFTVGGLAQAIAFKPAMFARFAEAWREVGLPS
jgi:adenylate cyclase